MIPALDGSRRMVFIAFAWFWLATTASVTAQVSGTNQIAGSVTLPDDGCRQAFVLLCDADSGEPLCRQNFQPFMNFVTNEATAFDWLTDLPDASGNFIFTNLPAGRYIVLAQAWNSTIAPTNFSLLGRFRSETVHLLGRAEVTLPSAYAGAVKLSPPGTNTIQFDQQFGNDDGLLMLGTQPQRGDPALGWNGWGTNFICHLIGFNAMPRGRTTVHGLPAKTYASIFMNDNSPGFGAMQLHFDTTKPVKMPIVAGWSDGYKIPPTNLVWLVELLQTNHFKIDSLLGITDRAPSRLNFIEREQFKSKLLSSRWNEEVVLPGGQKTTVADLLTALTYARLNGMK